MPEVAAEEILGLAPGGVPGIGGEASEAKGVEIDQAGAAVEDQLGQGLGGGGRLLEPGAAEAGHHEEPVRTGGAEDRVGIRRVPFG